MGFLAVLFALIVGVLIGWLFGIGVVYKTYYDTTDEEFDKKIEELKNGRNNYKLRHK